MKAFVATLSLALCTILIAHEGGAQGKKKDSSNLGTPKKEDVPKYLQMLQKAQNASDRVIGAEMLGKRGGIQVGDVKEAIPVLQKSATKDIDATVRKAAISALGLIATDPENSVPALMEGLKDKVLDVQLAAVSALGAYGPEARSALPELNAFRKAWTAKKDEKRFKDIMKLVGDTTQKINAKPKKDA